MYCTGCVDDALNYDQKKITSKQLEIDGNEGSFRLPNMIMNILSTDYTAAFEMQQSLSIDTYAQYTSLPVKAFGGINNTTYYMTVQWNDRIWLPPSKGILDRWVAMKKLGFDDKYPDLFAIATIVKAIAGQRLTDTFGPIPYSEYGQAAQVTFDSGKEVYDTIFKELKTSVATLKQYESENPGAWESRFSNDPSEYGGDYQKWIKLANTIRLRMAMRISDIDPERARTEAEAAVKAGVLTADDGDFEVKSPNGRHPYDVITMDWDEARLSATVETILKGYNDPRLSKYALPAELPELDGEIKGKRNGIPFPSTAAYYPFSRLNFKGNPPQEILSAAESYFLRSEGALRGWNMGGRTAKEFYEDGIRASFKETGVTGVEKYLNDDTSTPIAYVDPLNSDNNAPPLTDVTIKWNNRDSKSEKLERIIMQKWIALFPEGTEAWAEFRRTGYPKLYPIRKNESDGEVPDGAFIKRISYPKTMKNSSPKALPEAVDKYLNGNDSIGQRLWWDVD